jgi:hypothetical protein
MNTFKTKDERIFFELCELAVIEKNQAENMIAIKGSNTQTKMASAGTISSTLQNREKMAGLISTNFFGIA